MTLIRFVLYIYCFNFFATQNKLRIASRIKSITKQINNIKLKLYSWEGVTVAGKSPRSHRAYED